LEGYLDSVPVQLCRAPEQRTNGYIKHVYQCLLESLKEPLFHEGQWRLIEALPAGGVDSDRSWGDVIAWSWTGAGDQLALAVVNYSHQEAHCVVRLSADWLQGRRWLLDDLMGDAYLELDGNEMIHPGIALSLPAWGYHVFMFRPQN
jgi:hypothetical protein